MDCLARSMGMIVTQEQLIREAWGPERLGRQPWAALLYQDLRQKLEPDPRQPRYLLTEAGVGYRLQADEDRAT